MTLRLRLTNTKTDTDTIWFYWWLYLIINHLVIGPIGFVIVVVTCVFLNAMIPNRFRPNLVGINGLWNGACRSQQQRIQSWWTLWIFQWLHLQHFEKLLQRKARQSLQNQAETRLTMDWLKSFVLLQAQKMANLSKWSHQMSLLKSPICLKTQSSLWIVKNLDQKRFWMMCSHVLKLLTTSSCASTTRRGCQSPTTLLLHLICNMNVQSCCCRSNCQWPLVNCRLSIIDYVAICNVLTSGYKLQFWCCYYYYYCYYYCYYYYYYYNY